MKGYPTTPIIYFVVGFLNSKDTIIVVWSPLTGWWGPPLKDASWLDTSTPYVRSNQNINYYSNQYGSNHWIDLDMECVINLLCFSLVWDTNGGSSLCAINKSLTSPTQVRVPLALSSYPLKMFNLVLASLLLPSPLAPLGPQYSIICKENIHMCTAPFDLAYLKFRGGSHHWDAPDLRRPSGKRVDLGLTVTQTIVIHSLTLCWLWCGLMEGGMDRHD